MCKLMTGVPKDYPGRRVEGLLLKIDETHYLLDPMTGVKMEVYPSTIESKMYSSFENTYFDSKRMEHHFYG